MIKVDEKVKDYIRKDSRSFKARILCNGSVVDCEILKLEIKKGSCGGSLTPGSIFSNCVSCDLYTPSTELKGKKIVVQMGCELEGTNYFYDIATVYVKEVQKKEKRLSFTAYGVISSKMGVKFKRKGIKKVSELLTHMSNFCGEKVSLSEGLQDVEIPTVDLSKFTYSEILGYVAGLYFGYATEEADGSVKIRTYMEKDGEIESSLENMVNDPTIYEKSKVKGIHIKNAEGDDFFVGEEQNFSITNPLMTKSIFDANYNNFLSFEYIPCDIDLTLGDFTIEPTDIINFENNKINCVEITHTFDGGVKTSVSASPIDEASDYRGKNSLKSNTSLSYKNEGSVDKGIMTDTILISTNGSTHVARKWEDTLEIRQGRFATFRGRNPESIPLRYAPICKITAYPVIAIESFRFDTADYACYQITLYPYNDNEEDTCVKNTFYSGWLSPDDTYHPGYYWGGNKYYRTETWKKHNFWTTPDPDIWYEFHYILKDPIRKDEVFL